MASTTYHNKIINHSIIPLIIFVSAFFLRRYFFCGFILGDDAEEFPLIQNLAVHGPDFKGHLQYRFGMWLFNVIFFKLFGISEMTFFLPTWIMSSSLSVIGYYILLFRQYRPIHALFAGLFIASAPFEILIGTVRANDLILSWFLAMGFLFFVLFEKKHVLQGLLLAFFLWFAFYVKLWAIYLIPALFIYYIVQTIKDKIWYGLVSFSGFTLLFHGITSVFWKMKIGVFLPFLAKYSATYPVAPKDIGSIFLQYPKMLFQGSEFGTTLFGYVPYLLIALLLAKIILSVFPKVQRGGFVWDRFDLYLILYYGTFFFLLNFFPNSFKFDQYYSAPRIFRYLAPLSFPMTLHLAKLAFDFWKMRGIFMREYLIVILFSPLILINLFQTNSATMPGQIYRNTLSLILKDTKEQSPPKLLADSWLGFFLREVYLKAESNKIRIVPIYGIYSAKDYEKWLIKNQNNLPDGTMLITGLCNFVHYGGCYDGFRLRQFSSNLNPQWTLFREYGMLSYLPLPEPARLWRLSGKIHDTETVDTSLLDDTNIDNVDTLFVMGMNNFEKNNYSKARMYYKKIFQKHPDSYKVNDARYFYTICYFREGDWNTTIIEFKKMCENYPKSTWTAAAHYHIGLSYKELNDINQARKEFQYVIDNFSNDLNLVNLSKKQIEGLRNTGRNNKEAVGIIKMLFKKLFSNNQ